MSRDGSSGNAKLKALRFERRWTQEDFSAAFEARARELGEPLSLSVRQVRRWESANPPWPLPAYQRVLEAMFSVPVTEMGFPAPWPRLAIRPGQHGDGQSGERPTPPGPPVDDEGEAPVKRREFVAGAASLAGAPLVPAALRLDETQAWDRYAHPAEGGNGHSPEAVLAFERIAEQHRQLYWTVPASRVFAPVAAHAQLGLDLLASARGARPRARLGASVAQSTMLAARLAFFDMRQPQLASRCYQAALEAARVADDHALGAAVLTHMAFIPAFAGREGETRDLMRAARAHAARGVTATTRAWMCAVTAEMEAKLGDGDGALAHLDAAAEALSRSDPAEDPAWLDFFDASRYAGFQGYCQLRLGRADEARAALTHTLAHLPASAAKQQAVTMADLAAVATVEGDPEEACRLLHLSLATLRDHWYATAMDRVQDVRRSLAPWDDHRSVRDLDDALYSWTATTHLVRRT